MYIAMNKFKIINGYEQEFEEVWKTRDTFLDIVPGFLKFNLIKGKKETSLHYMRPTVFGVLI